MVTLEKQNNSITNISALGDVRFGFNNLSKIEKLAIVNNLL
jgi:hypothetical protein